MKYEYPIGEYNEGMPWEIVLNVDMEYADRRTLCPHVIRHPTSDAFILPRGIRAFNEGGFNATLLCADCVMHALTMLEWVLMKKEWKREIEP